MSRRESSPGQLIGAAIVLAIILGGWYFTGQPPHARMGVLSYFLH